MPRSRLLLAADSAHFNTVTISNWEDEGFAVSYLPFQGVQKDLISEIFNRADLLEEGEKYAIVAYGEAASIALEACREPMPKLCALVAYYPTSLPVLTSDYPLDVKIMLHLAASQGMGSMHRSYSYLNAEPGFAEPKSTAYDRVSASLAWTRTLELVRKGFGIDVDLESIWDEHLALEFAAKDVDATMQTMVAEPYVNHIPTLTGGIGYKDLYRFYKDYFIPNNPPSMTMRLLSRTIGTDRVVDEMHICFRHTLEIPWMLPGVEPTGKDVEVALVSIVCIQGGKLYHEHIYWDQASVLVQIGLLDPAMIPAALGKRLPVVGVEGARKVVDEQSVQSNDLIEDW